MSTKRTDGDLKRKDGTALKCVECGRFISYEDKAATVYFEPLNEFGPEIVDWTCGACNRKARP